MVGMQTDLYNKHGEEQDKSKLTSQQLDNNEVFQIKPIEHDSNDNLVQIKGVDGHGLFLYAHSKSTDLGCLSEYTDEDQSTFFELTQGTEEESWFIEAVFNNFESNSRFL